MIEFFFRILRHVRSSCLEVFCIICYSVKFGQNGRKAPALKSFFSTVDDLACNVTSNRTPWQVFPSEFRQMFQLRYDTEHLRTATSVG